jgi:hypothetical protein
VEQAASSVGPNRIVNEVRGIVTSKPPVTIDWE